MRSVAKGREYRHHLSDGCECGKISCSSTGSDELEERALAIALRESNFQHSALSGSKCCFGLFQIYYRWHTGWLPQVGVTSPTQLFDPRLNAAAAYRLYQWNGWGPWG
jgi:hypothetical protein